MMFRCNVCCGVKALKLRTPSRRFFEFAKQPFSNPSFTGKRSHSLSNKVTRIPSMEAGKAPVVIYYKTSWDSPTLRCSVNGAPWKDLGLTTSPHGQWRMTSIEAEQDHSSPILEFVFTDANGTWEKPKEGGNYLIQTAGNYRVQGGALRELKSQPLMLVSDLDGTMVGDDTATEAFADFWTLHSSLTNSKLVYNTGRSLDSFLKLMTEKEHCLKTPDVLISAVGTKIYNSNGGGSWSEDPGWVSQLDQDWNLDLVMQATQSALTLVGSDSMHFRPEDEQNEHKVTCGVRHDHLKEVLNHIQNQLDDSSIKANLIWSGMRDWRFLDIVSKNAGKLEALNYVREQHGFDVKSTVACGDSGNDILMLSGENPAIVVNNAQPDLKEWLRSEIALDHNQERLFLATKHEAYGILEGLEKFEFC